MTAKSNTPLAWIALGANLPTPQGGPRQTLERALRWLAATPGLTVRAASTLRWTAPVGPPQPRYLNGVAAVETQLAPEALLRVLHALERAAGRRRAAELRWGPRTLDLDLLLYGQRVVATPTLTLPHPRLHERRFVLEPLAELAPQLRHPVLDRSVAALLSRLSPDARGSRAAR